MADNVNKDVPSETREDQLGVDGTQDTGGQVVEDLHAKATGKVPSEAWSGSGMLSGIARALCGNGNIVDLSPANCQNGVIASDSENRISGRVSSKMAAMGLDVGIKTAPVQEVVWSPSQVNFTEARHNLDQAGDRPVMVEGAEGFLRQVTGLSESKRLLGNFGGEQHGFTPASAAEILPQLVRLCKAPIKSASMWLTLHLTLLVTLIEETCDAVLNHVAPAPFDRAAIWRSDLTAPAPFNGPLVPAGSWGVLVVGQPPVPLNDIVPMPTCGQVATRETECGTWKQWKSDSIERLRGYQTAIAGLPPGAAAPPMPQLAAPPNWGDAALAAWVSSERFSNPGSTVILHSDVVHYSGRELVFLAHALGNAARRPLHRTTAAGLGAPTPDGFAAFPSTFQMRRFTHIVVLGSRIGVPAAPLPALMTYFGSGELRTLMNKLLSERQDVDSCALGLHAALCKAYGYRKVPFGRQPDGACGAAHAITLNPLGQLVDAAGGIREHYLTEHSDTGLLVQPLFQRGLTNGQLASAWSAPSLGTSQLGALRLLNASIALNFQSSYRSRGESGILRPDADGFAAKVRALWTEFDDEGELIPTIPRFPASAQKRSAAKLPVAINVPLAGSMLYWSRQDATMDGDCGGKGLWRSTQPGAAPWWCTWTTLCAKLPDVPPNQKLPKLQHMVEAFSNLVSKPGAAINVLHGLPPLAKIRRGSGNLYKDGGLNLGTIVALNQGIQTAAAPGPGLAPANVRIQRQVRDVVQPDEELSGWRNAVYATDPWSGGLVPNSLAELDGEFGGCNEYRVARAEPNVEDLRTVLNRPISTPASLYIVARLDQDAAIINPADPVAVDPFASSDDE